MTKDESLINSFINSDVLITGGTGLVGRQIISMLCDYGANVTSISLDNVKIDNRAKYIYGDLADFKLCKEVTREMDFVFHLAGIKGSVEVTKTKPASFFVPLLMMNTNVLEACRINSVKKVVYTSSIGAYSNAEIFKETENLEGPPMDAFPGWAKRMAEMQIQAYKTQYNLRNFAIVRPCNVYGPGDNFDPENAMVIPSLMHKVFGHQRKHQNNREMSKEDPILVWGDGSAIRDFAYSKDVAEGIILALYYGTYGSSSGFVNIGSGKGCTIRELVETLHSFLDFEYKFDTTKSSGFPKRVMDISLARKLIHYNPTTSLLDGLKETWDWFIKNQDEHLNKKNYFKDDMICDHYQTKRGK